MFRAVLGEISVTNALAETAAIASRVRYPDSAGFFDAADYVAARASKYGLQNVRVERFPTARPMWDPEEAELEIVAPDRKMVATLSQVSELLAQHSKDGDLTAELVDVGAGVAASDYEGKNVKGKVLLADGDPTPVWRAAAGRGAVAMVCATSGEYFGRRPPREAVFWGMAPPDALAMMVSPRQGDEFRGLMSQGPVTVRLHARGRRSGKGSIGMVTGEIPGEISGRDVVLAGHLDHQKPAANDNASGAGALLEMVRALNEAIRSGRIAKPHRTLRFWWTTEIESERAWFQKHPEDAGKILLAVVLDQAGGELGAENNFVVIDNPDWLPSYADDLIHNLAESVRARYAPAEHEPSPDFVAPGGSRQSFRTVYWDYQPITDAVAFESREVAIPGIALAVPSLSLIHTNLDTVDRLDPTWMKRSTAITLAAALYAANAGPPEARDLLDYTFRRSATRLAEAEDPVTLLPFEQKRLDSIRALDPTLDTASFKARLAALAAALDPGSAPFRR